MIIDELFENFKVLDSVAIEQTENLFPDEIFHQINDNTSEVIQIEKK